VSEHQQLPRQVKLFGVVSLLNDFASEMVYPLLPAFVTGVLGGGALALGALDGAADAASAFVKFFAGRTADRPSRRGPLIIIGYLDQSKCPVPLRLNNQSEPPESSGLTVVRWIYPLPLEEKVAFRDVFPEKEQ